METRKDLIESARAWAKDNDDYHDSDGVDVERVFLAGAESREPEISDLTRDVSALTDLLTAKDERIAELEKQLNQLTKGN